MLTSIFVKTLNKFKTPGVQFPRTIIVDPFEFFTIRRMRKTALLEFRGQFYFLPALSI